MPACGSASRAAPAPAAERRIPRIRRRTWTKTGPSRRGSGSGSCPRSRHVAGTSASKSSNHRTAPPQERQKADQWPSTFRRSSRSQSAALPTRSQYRHGYDSLASHRRTEECSGDRARCRADRLVAGCEGVRPRPRGPARDLPQHARHPRCRRARAHPVSPGEDPGLLLHRTRQRGVGRRRRDRNGARRRRHPAAPRHGRAHHTWRRALADLRAVHGPPGRPDTRARRERAHGRRAPRAARDGQPSACDAAGRRSAARSPSASARRSASRSPGRAKARWRAATRTRA